MDSWKHSDVLAMLEGGNKQLGDFFARHALSTNSNDEITVNRYKTNAAKFYKKNLCIHVSKVSDAGVYMGRELSRQPQQKRRRKNHKGAEDKNECSLECQSLHQKNAKGNNNVGAEVR